MASHFIKIDIATPPSGATHFNPCMSLPFEKHENGKVFVWDGQSWGDFSGLKKGRSGSHKIRTEN